MRKTADKSVAEFLKEKISLCGKTQKEIAEEIGFEKPNIITMLKQGKTKLPIGRIGPLARAIDADPAHLLRLVMSEYSPETWEAIEDVTQSTILTANELKLVRAYREATGNSDAAPLVVNCDGIITIQAATTTGVAGPHTRGEHAAAAAAEQDPLSAHFLINDSVLGWRELSLERGLRIFHSATCVPELANRRIRVAFAYCAPVVGGGIGLQRVEGSELVFDADGRADEDVMMEGILTRIDPVVTKVGQETIGSDSLQADDIEAIRRCLGLASA